MEFKIKYIPVTAVVSLAVTLVIMFLCACNYDHIGGGMVYISDLGTHAPESCLFGEILNIFSFLMATSMYIRFRQIEYLIIGHGFSYKYHSFNKRAFFVGLIAAFGVSIVANFQETALLSVHWFGAILSFGLGAVYQCLQTSIYYKLFPIIGSRKMNLFRFCLSISSVTTFVVFFFTGQLSNVYYTGDNLTKWRKEDGGYVYHIISAVSEWICASGTIIYLVLFKIDFETVVVKEPEIFVHDNFVVSVNRKSSVASVDSERY